MHLYALYVGLGAGRTNCVSFNSSNINIPRDPTSIPRHLNSSPTESLPSLFIASDHLAPRCFRRWTISSRFNIGSRPSAIACTRELFQSIGDIVPTPLDFAWTPANEYRRRPSDTSGARPGRIRGQPVLTSDPSTPSFLQISPRQ